MKKSRTGQSLIIVLMGFVVLMTLVTIATKQITMTYGVTQRKSMNNERNQVLDVFKKEIDCKETLDSATPDLIALPEASLPTYCTTDPSNLKIPIFPLLDNSGDYITLSWNSVLNQGKFGQWYFRGGCFMQPDGGGGWDRCVVVHHAVPLADGVVVAGFRKDPLTGMELDWQPFTKDPICCDN